MRTLCLVLAVAGCEKPAPAAVEPTPATPTSNVDIADDALSLVDGWADALGGRDAIARLGTVHMKGDCTLEGRACTFEAFMSPKGELRIAATCPDGAFVSGFDGTSAWLHEGDTITDIAGEELDSTRRAAFLESYSMFFSDRQYGSITRDGATSLAIRPRGVTKPLVMRFRTDGLPVSGEAHGFRVVYGGWTEYLGVQVASSWTSGLTGTENSFRLSSVDDQQGTYAKPSR